MTDYINHPPHYISSENGLEAIEVIEAFIAGIEDGFEAYCIGNAFKYLCRYQNKGGTQDLDKAMWYISSAKDRRVELEKRNDKFVTIDEMEI